DADLRIGQRTDLAVIVLGRQRREFSRRVNILHRLERRRGGVGGGGGGGGGGGVGRPAAAAGGRGGRGGRWGCGVRRCWGGGGASSRCGWRRVRGRGRLRWPPCRPPRGTGWGTAARCPGWSHRCARPGRSGSGCRRRVAVLSSPRTS